MSEPRVDSLLVELRYCEDTGRTERAASIRELLAKADARSGVETQETAAPSEREDAVPSYRAPRRRQR